MYSSIFKNTRYNFIAKQDEEQLKQYKHNGNDQSILYKKVFSPIADKSLEYTPLWLAPNLITMIGFTCLLLPHLLVMFYIPLNFPRPSVNSHEIVPQWLWLMVGIGHLLYFNFDNMDGKQARRTNTSSALGMLIDHQADAVVVFIQTSNVCCLLQFDSYLMDIMCLTISTIPFFFTTLESYYTGTLEMPFINAANEGNITVASFFIIAGIFGQKIFQNLILGYTLSNIILYFTVVIISLNIIYNFAKIAMVSYKSLLNSFVKSLALIYMVFTIFYINYQLEVQKTSMRLVYIIYGFNFTKLCGCLQQADLTHSDFKSFRRSIIYNFSLINLICLYSQFFNSVLINEFYLLLAIAIQSFICYLQFIINITLQISEVLGINVFSIKKDKKNLLKRIK